MRTPLLLLLLFACMATRADTPDVRAHHALVYDEQRQQVLLAGGSSPRDGGQRFEFFDDLWAFDGSGWQNLGQAGAPLSGFRLVFDSNQRQVVSVGGYDGRGSVSLHRVLQRDRFESLTDAAPPATAEPGLSYERKRGQLLLFGGSAERGQALGDTWVFKHGRWSRLDLSSPAARQATMLLYMPSIGASLLFGGMDTGKPPVALGDTWLFDGDAWRELRLERSPSPRHSSGMAYDSKRKRVLLFGGLGADGFLGDTWGFDGKRWTELDAKGPTPRAMGYLAYDAKRDRVVLFGGRSGWPDADHNDTWEFDGRAWHPVATSARAAGQVATGD